LDLCYLSELGENSSSQFKNIMNQKDSQYPRIAWLLTSAFYYWQPMLKELTKLFPHTMTFTPRWHGYAPGFEDSFFVEIVGSRKIISLQKSEIGYGSNFTYLPINIVNYLFRFKPDIIFSNSFGVWTLICLLLKPLGRWRVVIAYEGSSPGVDYLNSPVRLALRRMMLKISDACITNSHSGEKYLIETLNASQARVFVHPYEVPCAASLLGNISKDSGKIVSFQKPILLFVGSLTPRKGLLQLLEACVLLNRQGLDGYSVVIVGDGSQKELLEDFSKKNNLVGNIHWIGKLDYGQLGFYFDQTDAFILPTLEDTWGVVVLEAMAFGKAILCSEKAGASELVIEGQNGYCFDPYNQQQVANIIKKFIDDQKLSQAMGQKSKELMQQYTPEAAAQFLSHVTKTVLENYPAETNCSKD
jgi:glycosyltransferase involved in cell wall biosynthesis